MENDLQLLMRKQLRKKQELQGEHRSGPETRMAGPGGCSKARLTTGMELVLRVLSLLGHEVGPSYTWWPPPVLSVPKGAQSSAHHTRKLAPVGKEIKFSFLTSVLGTLVPIL